MTIPEGGSTNRPPGARASRPQPQPMTCLIRRTNEVSAQGCGRAVRAPAHGPWAFKQEQEALLEPGASGRRRPGGQQP